MSVLPAVADGPRRADWAAGVRAILAAGLWSVVEVCTDVPGQGWEPRVVICRTDATHVEAAVAESVRAATRRDARVAGYTRDRLRRAPQAPAVLCHVAGGGA